MTFGKWQAKYAAFGIVTFPVSIEPERKKPLVSNYAKFGMRASTAIAQRFPDAAIAFMAGERNRITVLDVDTPDEAELRSALDRHGHSPIIVRSGSGHHQVWYRWSGEQRQIRPFTEYPIDILGDGMVVAPPSRGIEASYKFIQGDLADLAHLQPIIGLSDEARLQAALRTPDRPRNRGTVAPGRRNNTLFRECMTAARSCDDFDQLLDFARTRNGEYSPPLPDDEVWKVAKSVWGYEESGNNWIGRGRIASFSHSEIDLLAARNSDAFALLAIIRRQHWARSEFILSNAMADSLGWTLRRFRAARDYLIECGKLRRIHPGGQGPHDPPKFQLV